MDKILMAVFDDEGKAYEGSRILRELDAEGSIEVFAMSVIAKDASGKVRNERRYQEREKPMNSTFRQVADYVRLLYDHSDLHLVVEPRHARVVRRSLRRHRSTTSSR
jgi:hypothetical protein